MTVRAGRGRGRGGGVRRSQQSLYGQLACQVCTTAAASVFVSVSARRRFAVVLSVDGRLLVRVVGGPAVALSAPPPTVTLCNSGFTHSSLPPLWRFLRNVRPRSPRRHPRGAPAKNSVFDVSNLGERRRIRPSLLHPPAAAAGNGCCFRTQDRVHVFRL